MLPLVHTQLLSPFVHRSSSHVQRGSLCQWLPIHMGLALQRQHHSKNLTWKCIYLVHMGLGKFGDGSPFFLSFHQKRPIFERRQQLKSSCVFKQSAEHGLGLGAHGSLSLPQIQLEQPKALTKGQGECHTVGCCLLLARASERKPKQKITIPLHSPKTTDDAAGTQACLKEWIFLKRTSLRRIEICLKRKVDITEIC